MSNKAMSIYFLVFTILYVVFTVIIAKHGIHFTNFAIASVTTGITAYYYSKHLKE